MALSRCNTFLGTYHPVGRRDTTKTCSGLKCMTTIVFVEDVYMIVEPHCQKHQEGGHDQIQWSMSFLGLVEHLVHQVLELVADLEGFCQCSIAMTLFTNCHRKVFSHAPQSLSQTFFHRSFRTWQFSCISHLLRALWAE